MRDYTRKALVIEVSRDGYGINQIADKAVTVGELRQRLSTLDEDTLIILSHDSGYTYGNIDLDYSELRYEVDDGEDWVDEDGLYEET